MREKSHNKSPCRLGPVLTLHLGQIDIPDMFSCASWHGRPAAFSLADFGFSSCYSEGISVMRATTSFN